MDLKFVNDLDGKRITKGNVFYIEKQNDEFNFHVVENSFTFFHKSRLCCYNRGQKGDLAIIFLRS